MLKKIALSAALALGISIVTPVGASAVDFTVGQTVTLVQTGTPASIGTFYSNTTLGAGVAPSSGPSCTSLAQTFTYSSNLATCFNSQNYTPSHFQFTDGATYSYFSLLNPNSQTNYTTFFTEFELLIGGNTQVWAWTYGPNRILIGGGSVAASGDSTPITVTSTLRSELAARDQKISDSQKSIINLITSGKEATLEQRTQAGFFIYSASELNAINKAALALPKEKQNDTNALSHLVKLENLVYRISEVNHRYDVKVSDLVRLGLLAHDYAYKNTVLSSIKSLSTDSLDSIDKLQNAIRVQSKLAESRYTRLVNIMQKINRN